MSQAGIREAGKASDIPDHGWYTANKVTLSAQIDKFLKDVPDDIDGISLPIPGARVIIAPHAGYSFSGPTAGWAYKCLDLSKAKRVFVLGPSHTFYLQGCAVSDYQYYATPLGNLKVDEDVVNSLRDTILLPDIPTHNDDKEHSLEMHMPLLYKRCEQTFKSPAEFPTIVPILVGDNNKSQEKEVGKWLAPYLKDTDNAFIVSSDFCHWGSYFSYTIYCPEGDIKKVQRLNKGGPRPSGPPIHQTIQMVDDMAIEAIKTGKHDAFYDNLKVTRNTVCGRHPIGVTMAALEVLATEAKDEDKYIFKFVQYRRSSEVVVPYDSSVSYVSAYAII